MRSTLLRNCYPSWILDKIIKISVANFITPNLITFVPKKDCIYIGIPFLGKSTNSLRQAIKKIFKQYIANKDVIVYYKAGRRISSFFRLKDKIPADLKSMVVYEYSCGTCHCTYVGQTSRHLRHRVSEHTGLSHLSSPAQSSPVQSSKTFSA